MLYSRFRLCIPTSNSDKAFSIGNNKPAFQPFLHYLNRLPPWDGQDHILAMSVSVMVRGGTEKQVLFYEYLKKWLVAMVASWIDEDEVNQAVLV